MKTRSALLQRLEVPTPYAEPKPLVVEELEPEEPHAGELLVRVAAAGLCDSYLSVINGSRPRPAPMALGHEAAGVVERVGTGVVDVAERDHVLLTFGPSCSQCDRCSSNNPAMCRPAAATNGEGRMLGGGIQFTRGRHARAPPPRRLRVLGADGGGARLRRRDRPRCAARHRGVRRLRCADRRGSGAQHGRCAAQ